MPEAAELLTYRNLVLTMLLGGLWHGASWTFVVWGALHGGGLAVTRVFQRAVARAPAAAPRVLVRFIAVAAVGGAAHATLFRAVDSPWFHLTFAWLYLTPAWAATTAWLSLDERGPAVPRRPRLGVALGARALACALVVALGAALEWGTTAEALGAIAGALLAAAASDALELGGEGAAAWAWLGWAARRAGAVVLVFGYVCLAWVFFRARSFDNALDVLRQIGKLEWDHANVRAPVVIALTAGLAAHWTPPRTWQWLRDGFVAASPLVQGALMSGAGLALRELAHAHPKIVPFIYFQF